MANTHAQIEKITQKQEALAREKRALQNKIRAERQKREGERAATLGKFILTKAKKGSTEHQSQLIDFLKTLSTRADKELFHDLRMQYGLNEEKDAQNDVEAA